MGFFKQIGNFLTGTPEKRKNVSTLRPEQEGLYNQLQNAGQQQGAGGAFGDSADYYRNLINSDIDPDQGFDEMQAGQLRQYNQDIVPGLSEQFAGLGAGGLSSSGFRNAQLQGATDLSERLGALRAKLRQQNQQFNHQLQMQGAQGLQGIGHQGLQNFSQNMVTQQGSPGFLSNIAPAIGTAIGAGVGGPIGGALGNAAGSMFGGGGNSVGKNSSPYGGQQSPQASPSTGFQLPKFLQGQGA